MISSDEATVLGYIFQKNTMLPLSRSLVVVCLVRVLPLCCTISFPSRINHNEAFPCCLDPAWYVERSLSAAHNRLETLGASNEQQCKAELTTEPIGLPYNAVCLHCTRSYFAPSMLLSAFATHLETKRSAQPLQ